MSTQGNRIKKIREELRLTQEQFANIFGFNRAYLSAIEKDKSKLSVDNLVKLLLTYNVNMNYVLGGIGSMFIGQHKTDHTGIDEVQFRRLFKQCMKEEGFI